MKHRWYILLAFILFFTINPAFSQIIERNIHWTNKSVINNYPPDQYISEQSKATYYLTFKGAVYDDVHTMFPVYYEIIENTAAIIEYKLSKPEFETLNSDELKNIKHLEKLPTQIELKQKVHFSRKKPNTIISFVPLRKNPLNNQIEKLVSFTLQPKTQVKKRQKVPTIDRNYKDNSILASGNWVKIGIQETGVYKISYARLRELGISAPEKTRIFGNHTGVLPVMNYEPRPDDLLENKVIHKDYSIIFYAKGPHQWEWNSVHNMYEHKLHPYSDYNYLFLTDGVSGGDNTISNLNLISTQPDQEVTSYIECKYHESEINNFIQSGRKWYGELFDLDLSQDFSFDIPDLLSGSNVRLKVSVIARSFAMSSFTLSAPNFSRTMYINAVGSYYTAPYAVESTEIYNFNAPASNNITINLNYSKPTASSKGWLDYLMINAERELKMTGSQMRFRYFEPEDKQGSKSRFIISNADTSLRVWDVTTAHNVKSIPITIANNKATFTIETDSTYREFIAFKNGTYLSAETHEQGAGKIANQNLHKNISPDFIIISHPDFIEQARELATFRKDNDKLDTLVVTPQQIYNEFSSGSPDVSAIRDFVKMFYDRANNETEMPRYLLLFGDGSYDNKGNAADESNNSNYILTYQSENSLSPTSSYVSDDFFGLLDNNEGGGAGNVDIGIGRFPVQTVEQAQNAITKIKQYAQSSSMGDWRNRITLLGDDQDNNTHVIHAEAVADLTESLYPELNTKKIYLDAFQQISTPSGQRAPEVNDAINDQIKKGTLIFNYSGHGNEEGLAHEVVIDKNSINSWTNFDKLPIFMTATCEFSRFDDFNRTSAGEMVFLNPQGGGIALLTTTRLVYSSPNLTLNLNFYENLFQKNELGEKNRIGDVLRFTKVATQGNLTNRRNFTLLGDPSLAVPFPSNKTITTQINGTPVSESDTLKALDKITIKGYIANEDSVKLNDYNGTLYATIFDKPEKLKTLGQDVDSDPLEFELQDNIIYRGKATINNGEFNFSFIVPKDISYQFGNGKISYYAENGTIEANGANKEIIIGGSSSNPVNDENGPEIELFMNDKDFVFGGLTNEDPVLLAYVTDSSGINTTGMGIGHDITAVLNNNLENKIILNDAYEADKDSYQKGIIKYPLSDLEEGNHNINLKVWDVNNNSSEEYTEFIVVKSSELIIDKIFNYPNPFTQKTWFYFEHNQPHTDLEVMIQVITLSGKIVKTIQTTINTAAFRSDPIPWNGLDDFGDKIGRGVYIYRLKVRTPKGKVTEKYEKLLILK